MKNIIKIGMVIADTMEYLPLDAYVKKHGGRECDFFTRKGHFLSFTENGRTVEIHAVLCGIGMVNATAAASFLIAEGADIIINTGLSGGISGVRRGDITMPTTLIEHDFDLTPLGFEKGVKPEQNSVYEADKQLTQHYLKLFSSIICGPMVCGNGFVCGENNRRDLFLRYNTVSCDMESAAVAYVCTLAGVKFIAVRRISDDAGDNANTLYREMNDLAETDLVDIVFKGIYEIPKNDELWIG